MKQCQEELMRKKNSIIQDLQRTEKSLLDEVNTNPRVWNRGCFEFKLTTQANLVLKADIKIEDPAEKKRIDAKRNADRIEASRRRREAEDLRVKKAEDEARLRRVFKYDYNVIYGQKSEHTPK